MDLDKSGETVDWRFSYDSALEGLPGYKTSKVDLDLLKALTHMGTRLRTTTNANADECSWALFIEQIRMGLERGIPKHMLEEASGLRSPTLENLASGALKVGELGDSPPII